MAPGGDTMLAAVYQGDRTMTVEHLPIPTPAADEVLVEVSHCGICGTDLHYVLEGWGRPGSVNGHEYSGLVVGIGDDVTDVVLGARVVGGPSRGCGRCQPCARGKTNLCAERDVVGTAPFQGAFARYKTLGSDSVYVLPDTLDLRTAALAEPVAVALRGVRRSGVQAGDRALVTGAGPIGLLTVALLRALGVDDITVSEPHERRRDLAVDVGATRAAAPDAFPEPTAPTEIVAEPYDAAIECSGRADAITMGLSHLARGGTLVLSGTGLVRPRFDSIRIIVHELTVTGSMEYTPDDFTSGIELIASGRLPTDLLIEGTDVPLSGVLPAMERLAAGELAAKVMVTPDA